VGNLWDVTDKDIDRFGQALLSAWLDGEGVSLRMCDNTSGALIQRPMTSGCTIAVKCESPTSHEGARELQLRLFARRERPAACAR
jgi:hypothetical protein